MLRIVGYRKEGGQILSIFYFEKYIFVVLSLSLLSDAINIHRVNLNTCISQEIIRLIPPVRN